MIQSMTGYGKAELNLKNANFTIEVRSLNSKQIDVSVKMSSIYRDKEIGLRRLLSEKFQRGKIELSIWKESSVSNAKYTLNTELLKEYFQQIEGISNSLNLNSKDIMSSLLKMPEVLTKGEEKSDEDEWAEIAKGIDIAIEKTLQFRLDEGKKLEEAIVEASTIRLRPILMTSLSTVFGVLPLIIGSGPGAASRLTVGITIFSGMLFSTFFTLYVIPTIYSIIGKNEKNIDAVEVELNKQLKK